MSDFYTPAQRQLQGEFKSEGLAAVAELAIVVDELSSDQADFIHDRNMFFLSTVDELGFPSCSYKGGSPGFVRVTGARELVFPSYDGNGMFMSMGNIEAEAKVGLLFIDFETPRRLRIKGEARLLREGPMFESFPGADMAVAVTIHKAWHNCPRYVHRMQSLKQSPYVPAEDGSSQLAPWKRIDLVQDALSEPDRAQAQTIGLITTQDYEAMVESGEGM